MAPPLLQLTDIRFTLGGKPLLEGVDLQVGRGDRICLVGRNGSGKSTLMRIAEGLVEPDAGRRFLQPDATLRVLAQEPDLAGYSDVLSYVEAGLGPLDESLSRAQPARRPRPQRRREACASLGRGVAAGRPGPRAGAGTRHFAARRTAQTTSICPPSNGWRTNSRGFARPWSWSATIGAFSPTSRVRPSGSTVGGPGRIEQGFGAFEAWRDETLEQEELDRHKLDRKIAAEEDWVRYGVTGRRKRNVGRMANLQVLRQARRTTPVQSAMPG